MLPCESLLLAIHSEPVRSLAKLATTTSSSALSQRRRPDVLEQAHHLLHGGPLLRRARRAEETHLQALGPLLLGLRPRRLVPQRGVHDVEPLAVADHATRPARGRLVPPGLPRHQLEHQDAEPVHVALRRLAAAGSARDDEVGDPRLHVVAEEDVGRDQVPVHDGPPRRPCPPLVQERHAPGYAQDDAVTRRPVAGGFPAVLYRGIQHVDANVLCVYAAGR
jgi:hypothetical protein